MHTVAMDSDLSRDTFHKRSQASPSLPVSALPLPPLWPELGLEESLLLPKQNTGPYRLRENYTALFLLVSTKK